jgi:hypothetical protein
MQQHDIDFAIIIEISALPGLLRSLFFLDTRYNAYSLSPIPSHSQIPGTFDYKTMPKGICNYVSVLSFFLIRGFLQAGGNILPNIPIFVFLEFCKKWAVGAQLPICSCYTTRMKIFYQVHVKSSNINNQIAFVRQSVNHFGY